MDEFIENMNNKSVQERLCKNRKETHKNDERRRHGDQSETGNENEENNMVLHVNGSGNQPFVMKKSHSSH